ncbi:MAG: hypothetical protein H0X25_08980 [Acidobacteriales bacterium]|nr:hypothetical protein [Terriglobales bacterium]
MKNIRTRVGPFNQRPFYTNSEIENMCIDELQRAGLLPSTPEPIRIDRFLEKRFNISYEYDDLPSGLLGYTRFSKSGVQQIVVARSLDDSSTSNDRRVRSTLAHEAGHGLMHAHLFALSGQSSLFPEGEGPSPRVLCRDEATPGSLRKYSGEWWEFQANRAIGDLLVPRALAYQCLADFLEPRGLLGLRDLSDDRRVPAAKQLAEIFDVNPAVATIRIEELFPRQNGAQGML